MTTAANHIALNKFNESNENSSSRAKSFIALNVFEKPAPRGIQKVIKNIK